MANIQFNLLPDVKSTYINAQRNRRAVTLIAFITSAISIAIFVLVFLSVEVVQKAQLSGSEKDAKAAAAKLKAVPNIGRIITVQNQLQTLSSLHQGKHALSRIFTYIPQLTPASANIGSLTLDTTTNSLQINGTADSQKTINAFVDTLKYATYKVGDNDSEHPAFSAVTLNNFDITPGKASYSISATYDPNLFASPLGTAPTLSVKNQVTTRSVLDDPSNPVFNGQTTTDKPKQGTNQ
jgi:Tfp pilus assembly protein PilN